MQKSDMPSAGPSESEFLIRAAILIASAGFLAGAAQPWKSGDPGKWTQGDVERILQDSPWAQSAGASFGLADEREPPPPGPLPGAPEAGLAGPRGASDGHWDGGIGRTDRGGPPTLNVTVRWNSALPVHQALAREHGTAADDHQPQNRYELTVMGLVPAGRYGRPELATRSGDSNTDVRNPEEMLEGVMRYSRLFPKGKPAIHPEDARIDSATGDLHIFFSRAEPISIEDKEVTFQMRFGSLSVVKRFRLKDMVYNGRLEL
jgi:hypothetical protein